MTLATARASVGATPPANVQVDSWYAIIYQLQRRVVQPLIDSSTPTIVTATAPPLAVHPSPAAPTSQASQLDRVGATVAKEERGEGAYHFAVRFLDGRVELVDRKTDRKIAD